MKHRTALLFPRVLPRALHGKRTRGTEAKGSEEFAGVPPAHRCFASPRFAPARHPGSGSLETPPPLTLRGLAHRSRGASPRCELDLVRSFK